MQRYNTIAVYKETIWRVAIGLCLFTHSLFAQPFRFSEKKTRATIAIEIQHNLMLLPVRVNGSIPVYFILDTGVRNTLLIEPTALALMGVVIDETNAQPTQIRGLGENSYINALKVHGVRLSVADALTADSMNVTLLPDGAISYAGMFDRPVLGIIGSDIFSHFVVRINYEHKTLHLYAPNAVRFAPPKWHILPIALENAKPYAQARLAITATDTPVLRQWLLDTGASCALLFFDSTLSKPLRTLPADMGVGLGGTLHGVLGKAQRLTFSGIYPAEKPFPALIAPIVGFPDSASIAFALQGKAYYANIGAEVLSRFHIVFDYPHRRVFLRPNHAFRKEFSYNYSGIDMVKNLPPVFNAVSVRYIRPHSPAAAADILVGDIIRSIGGTSLDGLSLEIAYGLLHERPNRRIYLDIERAGVRMRKRIYLKDEL